MWYGWVFKFITVISSSSRSTLLDNNGICGGERKTRDQYWCLDQHDRYSKVLQIHFYQILEKYDYWGTPLDAFHDKDGIYFLKHKSHCFTLLYIHTREIAFIADGGNVYLTIVRRRPEVHKQETSRQIADMLHKGIIESCDSPSAAAYVVVRKKTGELRICFDFRRLNAQTVKTS